MRLGCSTASFPEDRWEIAIAKVGWAGYPGVELALPAELPDEQEAQSRLRANGLELAAVYAGTLPSDSADLEALAGIGRAAAFARALDGSVAVVSAPATGTLEGLAASLRLLDEALRDRAVDLCVVNGRGTLLDSLDALRQLWGQRLPERVGIALDPGQALLAGWDPLNPEALPELPRHVYLTDANGQQPVPPGEGSLDAEALGEALRRCGYAGSVVLRLENADPWAVEPIVRETVESATAWLLR
ncbi:MAG: Xylose isomerase-like barrel [Armatimonadetes bacterium]|nr:Xylose isomerase-like barrel [Armatimonadota bacterium]